MAQSHEQGTGRGDGPYPPHGYPHPEWEQELISRPDGRQPAAGAGQEGHQEAPQQPPRFAPEELAPSIGDIALIVV